MSSVINLTTGECISGTCQSLEGVKPFAIFILCLALFFIVSGFILTWIEERKKKAQNRSNMNQEKGVKKDG